MALELECCNVIVPVRLIRERLGDAVFERRFASATEITWQDGHLFRDGCMNHYDLKAMLDEWEARGFELLTEQDGQKEWRDLCVVNSHYGPSYPCPWIEYDAERNIVWLKGQEPGPVVGPSGRKVAGEE